MEDFTGVLLMAAMISIGGLGVLLFAKGMYVAYTWAWNLF